MRASTLRRWNSSYTKQPIPADEMREWVDNTVEEILSLHPAEILEIGCGTGLLLLRIAPTSKRYVGMDFSASSLKSLRKQMAALDGKQSAVTLLERPADDFKDLDDNSFDTIIINSVVQYFPSLEHLTKVLEGALKATKPRRRDFCWRCAKSAPAGGLARLGRAVPGAVNVAPIGPARERYDDASIRKESC